tara:strand:+ start:373 stop:513 length:141 start_codon:yes stop_codon:yes gene_type:complete
LWLDVNNNILMYRQFKNQIKKELMNIEVPKFGKYIVEDFFNDKAIR